MLCWAHSEQKLWQPQPASVQASRCTLSTSFIA
jgi:hypothetical protein